MYRIRNYLTGGNNKISLMISYLKGIGIVREILYNNVNYKVNLRS